MNAKTFLLLVISATSQFSFAQGWLLTGNSGNTSSNFLGTSDFKPVIFKTNSIERGRLMSTGIWRFGNNAVNAALIDTAGVLTFLGTGMYKVADNKYVFQNTTNPNYGLFFNATTPQYEFRDSTGNSRFSINASNGNSTLTGTLKIGAYTLPNTDGSNGQVLATNGSGIVNWATVSGGSGANTALSNLISTSINQSLIPASDSAFDLGSKIKAWKNLFVDGKIGVDVDPVAKVDIRAVGTSASNYSLRITNLLQLGLVNTLFSVRDDGRVGIGTSNPSVALHVVGDAFFNTTNTDCDLRQKTNVTDMGWFASGSANAMRIYNYTTSKSLMTVLGTGEVGIGTTTPDYSLDVCGTIRSKEVIVQTGWCDYVFDKNYQLKPLEEVDDFISKNKHLPNIPSASEVEANGLKVADMGAKMMEKIEELTLYLIQQNEKINKQTKQIQVLTTKLENLEKTNKDAENTNN